MEYWKTKQFGEVYEPSNNLTPDDCWQAYEAMDDSDKSTMTYYAEKIVKRVPKLGIKGAVEVVFKMQLELRKHEGIDCDEFGMSENARCNKCGSKLQIVRPGKYQCEVCG